MRLAKALRERTRAALKRGHTGAIPLLGCTLPNLKKYIENQFTEGMCWETWGKNWHLDHVKPLASFDLADSDQLREACHHTNLQPLLIEVHKLKTTKERQMRAS